MPPLHPYQCLSLLSGKPFVVEFDFLGKDSIRYNNCMAVEKRVYKNVTLFMENKKVSPTYNVRHPISCEIFSKNIDLFHWPVG